MDSDDIVLKALGRFLEEDEYLLENNTSERSMTHRIGLHLQNAVDDSRPNCKLHVDCEWDRNVKVRKTVDLLEFSKKIIHSETEKAAAIVESINADGFKEKALEKITAAISDLRESTSNSTSSDDEEKNARDELKCMMEDYTNLLEKLTSINRNLGNAKASDEVEKILKNNEGLLYEKQWGRTGLMPIIPDIICHERGKNDNNKFVIEAKKSRNSADRRMDYIKLACMVADKDGFSYDKGYALDIPVENDYAEKKGKASFKCQPSDYGIFEEMEKVLDIVYSVGKGYPYQDSQSNLRSDIR